MMVRLFLGMSLALGGAWSAWAQDATQDLLAAYETVCAGVPAPESVAAIDALAAKAGFVKQGDPIDNSAGDRVDIFAFWLRGQGDGQIEFDAFIRGAPANRNFACNLFAKGIDSKRMVDGLREFYKLGDPKTVVLPNDPDPDPSKVHLAWEVPSADATVSYSVIFHSTDPRRRMAAFFARKAAPPPK